MKRAIAIAALAAVVLVGGCTTNSTSTGPTSGTGQTSAAAGQTYTPPSHTPWSEPQTTASPTMNRDEIERLKTRVDAALDEVNPAKDTLVAALDTHDFAAVHIGCRPVGQAGRDLSAALAEAHGYVLTSKLAQMVAQLQRAADGLEKTERDCLALWPGSTEAEWDQVVTDMRQVAQDLTPPS